MRKREREREREKKNENKNNGSSSWRIKQRSTPKRSGSNFLARKRIFSLFPPSAEIFIISLVFFSSSPPSPSFSFVFRGLVAFKWYWKNKRRRKAELHSSNVTVLTLLVSIPYFLTRFETVEFILGCIDVADRIVIVRLELIFCLVGALW